MYPNELEYLSLKISFILAYSVYPDLYAVFVNVIVNISIKNG